MRSFLFQLSLLLLLFVFSGPGYAEEQLRTYSNDVWGYSITFPSNFYLFNDPELIRKISQEGAREVIGEKGDQELLDMVDKIGGQQFVLLTPAVGGEEMNASLNLLVEQVSQPGFTNKSYFDSSISYLPRLNAEVTSEPKIRLLHGRQFYTQDYTLDTNLGVLKGCLYCHYDPASKVAFVLSITGRLDQDEAGIQALHNVMESFVIENVPQDFLDGPNG